jgi:O-antigen ligase
MTRFAWLLVVVIAWGTLAFGAVYPWAYWPLAAACAALGVWGMLHTRNWREGRSRLLVWCLVAVGVAITVQIVPLPLPAFTALSPGANQFLAQYDLAYSLQPPGWHALSVEPWETAVALGLFVALALWLLGLIGMMGRLPLDRIVMTLALFAVAVSIFAVVQRSLVVEGDQHSPIYGFWQSQHGGLPFGPFVNPNHFAGWVLLILAVTFGYFCGLAGESWDASGRRLGEWLVWLTRPEAGRAVLLLLSVLAMATALVLTRSRSGVASFVVVMTVFGLQAVRRATGALPKIAAAATVTALVVGALAWGGLDSVVAKFDRATADAPGRLTAWRDALHIAHDFPIFGSGLGTFGPTMLIYQSGQRAEIYFQAHNDYLQLAAEGGLIVGVAALALVLTIGWLAWRRSGGDEDSVTGWIRTGAIAGLIGMAAQSAVEFSLQMPGVTVLFVLLIAIAVHRPVERQPHAHRL